MCDTFDMYRTTVNQIGQCIDAESKKTWESIGLDCKKE